MRLLRACCAIPLGLDTVQVEGRIKAAQDVGGAAQMLFALWIASGPYCSPAQLRFANTVERLRGHRRLL